MSDDDRRSDPAPEPVHIDGVTETDYAVWLHHDPVAQLLMRYLKDFADDVEKSVLEQWREGPLDPIDSSEKRGFVRALREITSIRLPQIAAFYEQVATLAAEEAEAERKAIHGSE